MSEPDEPSPPVDPPKGAPQPVAADSAKLASADVPEGSDTARVFISYASADSSIANSVCHALERAGVKCWIAPRDVTPGDLYSANIVHAIDTTRVVVLVLSKHAADSAHVLREVERASSKRHPVLTFRLDQAPLPDGLAYFLNTAQWLDASTTGVNRALPKLVDAVKSVLAKGTPAAPASAAPSIVARVHQRSSRMLLTLGVVIAAALVYVGVDRLWLSTRVDSQMTLVDTPSVSQADSSRATAIPAKSIAVLPFADMSEKKDQEYMSDGITEELLNLLAQVPDLKVIARTSSFAFKGQNLEIAEIAKKLNVAHVLEGSIRTSGNQMRVTAQLVRAADSTHLWSERYDRPLDDIFAVQDEIANAIVQALQIKLQGGTLTRREGGTDNLEAYRLYLRAWSEMNQNTRSSLDIAEASLESALDIDANYGMAWDLLGSIWVAKADNGFIPATEGYKKGREFTLRALQLSPNLAAAHASLGSIHMAFDWDWSAAEVQFKKAFAIDPSDLLALNEAGRLANALGQWEKSERLFRAALARDPLDPFVMWNLGNTRYLAGQLAEAEDIFRQLLAISPSFGWTRPFLGKTLLLRGKPEEALRYIEQEPDEIHRLLYLPVVLHALGRREESDEALQAQIRVFGDTAAVYVAQNYAYRDDKDHAMEWLERAYRQKDPGLIEIVGESLLKGMADDPRYKAFLRKMNLPETPGE